MIIIISVMNTEVTRKHSRKRDVILEVIRSTGSHPTAAWVYDKVKRQVPDLSLATVYRNITQFREEGEVISVGVKNGEECFDGRVEPHPHFVCEVCGDILDLTDDAALTDSVAGAVRDGVTSVGAAPAGVASEGAVKLKIDFRKTVFYGICSKCGNDAVATAV
jgi:Fur family peroxide stress response transcriptional regulator